MADVKKERKVKDFSKGMIYRIVCNITGDVYIGSSVQTCAQRLSQHVAKHKLWVKDNTRFYYSSFIIIARNDYKIILVESHPCKNNDELFSREQHWIEQTECINKRRAHSTLEQKKEFQTQYRKDNAEKIKQYSKDNAEKIKQYSKDDAEKIKELSKNYRAVNAEKIKELSKNYRAVNAEKIKEWQKQHYQNNAEKIKQVITCECGTEVTQCNKARHNKSQKHINFTQE